MKLLSISTDRNIFFKDSAVALRQIAYAEKYEEVHIIIFTDKSFAETSFGSNIWIYPTRSSSRWMYIWDALRLGRFIVQKRGITHITCQDPAETGLVGVLIKNRHNIELELQIHTDIGSPYFSKFSFLNKIRVRMAKFTLSRADTVRVVSERIKKFVQRFVDESKITVRPISIEKEKIKNTPITTDLHKKYPQFSKIVLMASRLEPEKNVSMALRALKKVLEKIPQAGLIIAGSGKEEKNLRELAKELGIESSVIFEGWQKDLISYYKTSDCFLVTSWYEGYGMTLLEAQAAGCKIVSTDVGVAKEIKASIVEYTLESIAEGLITTLL